MKRRWKVSEDFLWAMFILWAFGWAPLYCVFYNVTGERSADVFAGAWFGVLLVPACLVGCGYGLRYLWTNRPRRAWESVEDIRERHEERR